MQSEAVWAQQVSHPNLVRVHDYHQDGDTCFLTMELLEGEPLRRVFSRLQPATMPTKKAMRIIAGMCRGLAHAHANGLVHADLKPGNVFLTKDNEPKIFDFGSAQIAASGNRHKDESLKPGSKGLRAVTPAYASCNRLEGGAPGFSDDVYSLCCVIYELLAGRHPYDRKSALVARELNLQPERIKELTDLQWRTLATGLLPSREDRSTEVHDLLEVFDDRKPATSPSPPVKKQPVFLRILTVLLVGLMLGAGLLYSAKTFDIPLVPTDLLTRQSADVESPTALPAPVPVSEETFEETQVAQELVATDASPGQAIIDKPDIEPQQSPAEIVEMPVAPPTDSGTAIPPGFLFSSSEYRVNENVAAVAIQIERQGDVSEPASVQWTTFSGSAEPQVDYVSFFRNGVRFNAGETAKTILIPIVSDSNAEFIEEFRIELSRPDGNMVLAQPSTVTVTIVDDDF